MTEGERAALVATPHLRFAPIDPAYAKATARPLPPRAGEESNCPARSSKPNSALIVRNSQNMRPFNPIPPRLTAVTLTSYVVTLGLAIALLLWPQGATLLGLTPDAAGPMAFLLTLNAFVLGLVTASLRLKFREDLWTSYVLGTSLVAAALFAALDGGLLWQVARTARWDLAGLGVLALPGLALAWVALRIMTDKTPDHDLQDALTDIEAPVVSPTAEPAPTPILTRIWRFLVYMARYAIIAIITLQLVALAALVIFMLGLIFWEILASGRAVPLERLGELTGRALDYIGQTYSEFAWPLARGTAMYAGLLAAFYLVIIPPLTALFKASGKAYREKRLELTDAQRDWVSASTRAMLEWMEGQPKRRMAIWVTTLSMIGGMLVSPALLIAGSYYLTQLINASLFVDPTSLLQQTMGAWGVALAGITGFFLGIVVGIAAAQITPWLKTFWASQNRYRLQISPEMIYAENQAALDSAARRGWYPMTAPFDPEAFHHRWAMRSINFSKTALLFTLPLILALCAFDANWFTSWSPTGVTHSGPFQLTAHHRSYAEALRVETKCEVREDEDGPVANLNYAVIFPDEHRLSLRTQLKRNDDALPQINTALREAGVEFVDLNDPDLDSTQNRAACYALLRENRGEDGARIVEMLEYYYLSADPIDEP